MHASWLPAAGSEFVPLSRWHGIPPLTWAVQPRKAWRALGNATVAIRFLADSEHGRRWGGIESFWTFDRARYGDRVNIAFSCPTQFAASSARWQILANTIHAIASEAPDLVFHDVAIDLGDGVGPAVPGHVHGFARAPGAVARLIPNPYLLRPRPWLTAPLPWGCKTDVLYFRGASTGSREYEHNARVVLCRIARTLPRADCRVSRTRHSDPAFAARLREEGLVGWRHPLDMLNLHRFLVDVDGHTSSWDRFMLIGTVGGVPIRFENRWQECWHHLLVDGEHAVSADRHTLPHVIERLRTRADEARHVARAARHFVRDHLSVESLRRSLAESLRSAAGAGTSAAAW